MRRRQLASEPTSKNVEDGQFVVNVPHGTNFRPTERAEVRGSSGAPKANQLSSPSLRRSTWLLK